MPDPNVNVPDVHAAPAPPVNGQNGMPPTLVFAVPGTAVMPNKSPRSYSQPALIFNRELSWLDFNWRVLYQALDARIPLLERVRFLGIAANNLDEFFLKRVGGLKRLEAADARILSPDGRTPTQQLALIRPAVLEMQRTMLDAWTQLLRPALRDEVGLVVDEYDNLKPKQKQRLHAHFMRNLYPILTPLAVDPGHPFPFISNLSLSLAVLLRHPTRGTEHFARLKIPLQRGRWVQVDGNPMHVVPIEQVIAHNVGELFRGMELVSVSAFRVTRNADLGRNEEEADDLLALISEELRERRFARVVRIQIDKTMPLHVRHMLMEELELGADDVYEADGLLEVRDCMKLANYNVPEHMYAPWQPVVPNRLMRDDAVGGEGEDIFSILRKGDLLVHHPYESFSASVARFIEEAALDARVLAIKQTLYRTADESPIIKALVRAAERGKQVAVLVEVKARFDEANNMEWGQVLENAGVHVTYGLVGLKTHTKTALVIREDDDGIRAYYHIGTGNYNHKTARLYTDVGLLSCGTDMGNDLINLFHYLTGYSPEQRYRKLLVAPRDMRRRFIEHIRKEVSHQKKHGNGRIIAKMNALDDVRLIQELYRASAAGVQIDLLIRGHCRLRPGLPQYSENIRVSGIIGRFLEHSRIYYFYNNGTPRYYFGSADWQRRNLDDRVEVIAPLEDPALQARFKQILDLAMLDNRLTWDLQPDGHYIQRHPGPDEPVRNFHAMLSKMAHKETETPWDL